MSPSAVARRRRLLLELEAMGARIDDKRKSWALGPPRVAAAAAGGAEAAPLVTATVPCKACGHMFASRNRVFKHIRGGECEASPQAVSAPGLGHPNYRGDIFSL